VSAPVAFSTGSLYPFGLDRVYGMAAEAGYDGVEIMMDDRWDTHQENYLRELAGRHGLPILALHPPLGRGAWRLDPEETLVRVARLAGRVGARTVVAHPPPPERSLERWAKETLAEAREHGVAVAVENMPRNPVRRFFFTRERQSCFLPEHLLGLGDVTLDTSHVAASGVDLMHAYSVLSDQVRHVHLSDSRLSGGDEHRLPGKGRLPLKQFLGALGEGGYSGVVSLELKPWPLGAPDLEVILKRMREALLFTREGLGKWP
jgi:sugar phosphate isomerase/epimerase